MHYFKEQVSYEFKSSLRCDLERAVFLFLVRLGCTEWVMITCRLLSAGCKGETGLSGQTTNQPSFKCPPYLTTTRHLLCPPICSAHDSGKTNPIKWSFDPSGPISKQICGIYAGLQQSKVFA